MQLSLFGLEVRRRFGIVNVIVDRRRTRVVVRAVKEVWWQVRNFFALLCDRVVALTATSMPNKYVTMAKRLNGLTTQVKDRVVERIPQCIVAVSMTASIISLVFLDAGVI